ncbi:YodL domain-containing protein [Anaerotignum sp.]|uniref:YodL domain-containing protein n=1 Tax=Anaerotignum sp. TaxID=2039241 RepID=UPI0028AFF8FB|nr:YodL domain-containing protein [Anaerotignum sp.]
MSKNILSEEQEKAFLDSESNAFAIYQLKDNEELRNYRFTGTKELESLGLSIDRENYNLMYVGQLGENISLNHTLNEIYQQFNIDHPQEFTGHSLSVSDVVSLNVDGMVSSHFVDSFGFEEQPLFLRDVEVEEFIGEDYFFIDEKNGTFSWLYFNEDGSDGGHFVKNDLYFQDVIEAAKEHQKADDFFNQSLADKSLQYLADVGTVHFYDMKKQFTSGTHQLSGLNDITMKELIKKAENYLRATELSTEENFNMIDGIVNNQPQRKEDKAPQIAKNSRSVLSKLKAFKEMDTQKKAAMQKNKEVER